MRRQPIVIFVLILIVVASARGLAGLVIEYQWWKELGQARTWISILLYSSAPPAAAAILAFAVFWTAHARGLRFAGERLRHYPLYGKIVAAGLLVLSGLIAAVAIHNWTVVRYFGGRALPGPAGWADPVFGRSLAFYLFELPFYQAMLGWVLAVSLVAAAIYWLTARGWQLRSQLPGLQQGTVEFDLRDLRLAGAVESRFLRAAAVVFLAGLAARFVLGRYSMLLNEHGFLVGVDWVNENLSLPLQWLAVAASLSAAALVWLRRLKIALILRAAVPGIVAAVYVRPNELALQRPYIERHIQATRNAFGFAERTREVEFAARLDARIDSSKHQPLFDNVRLWDWRAFHDTVTQIQALRPYYVFPDSDVDRYTLQGRIRQVLLSPRELDVRNVAATGTGWINSHLIYTHGYGMVMAEANRMTREGLPELLIYDAPPRVDYPGLKLTRPEIYFGERTHDPVFVRTNQPEFDYPSGSENVHTRYEGAGGIPISSFLMRLAAALNRADWNILLTGYITPESRMLIRRRVEERLSTLAGFIRWDPDPYLVLTEAGRLIWIVDGYTTADVHPYSRHINAGAAGTVNYIRNSVKATVDAYDGSVRMFIFQPADPVIRAYRRLFPDLFQPASEMPPELRAHARYPELIFRAQAEVYRTFHMLNPEAFYNKEDLWDIANNIQGEGGRPNPMPPTFVVATLPGEDKPEFLLVLPFTPRNKDNLIGLMVARCDGPHLGELVFLQLSKQALIFGPMQIEARINQDQNISKDLSLWNQQGSQVLRGQMLVLPIEDTFLYVEAIYIQAAEARMPQLKKVVLAMGNNLIYEDTYEQALARLTGMPVSERPPGPSREAAPAAGAQPPAPAARPSGDDPRIPAIRQHLDRYRSLASQGRWAEAGKELEALEALVRR